MMVWAVMKAEKMSHTTVRVIAMITRFVVVPSFCIVVMEGLRLVLQALR